MTFSNCIISTDNTVNMFLRDTIEYSPLKLTLEIKHVQFSDEKNLKYN